MKVWRMAVGCLAAALVSGCATTATRSAGPTGAAVHTLEDVLREAGDHRVQFFDREGAPASQWTSGASGSVSVYLADHTGQDNYSINRDGRVVRHQRSYGDDYRAGVWMDVPRPASAGAPLQR